MSERTGTEALNKDSLASATRWMVLGRVVTQGSRFLVSIILARLLTPEAFGLVAVAMTTILALEIIKDLGTGNAVIQQPEVDQRLLSSVFYLNVLGGVVTSGIMALGAPFIADLFSTPDATPVIRGLSLVMLVSGATWVHHALLRRSMRFNGVAAVEMAGALTTGAVSVALALTGFGVWSMVWGNVAGAVAGSLMAWVKSGWRPSLMFSPRSLLSIAGFSLNTSAFNATKFALQNADKVLVARWLGAGPLGIYSFGQRTINYPVESIAHVLMTVMFPAFARAQDDHAALRRGFRRAVEAIAFVTLPVMVGAAVMADPLVRTGLGDQWLELIPLLWFMAPAGAVAALVSACQTLYSAKGRADWLFRWGLASGAFTVGAFALGLQWGLQGLAVAYLAAQLVLMPVGYAIVLSLIDERLSTILRALVPYLLITAAMAAAAAGASYAVDQAGGSSVMQLVAGVPAGAVVYAGLSLWIRPPAARDLRTLVDTRRGKKAAG